MIIDISDHRVIQFKIPCNFKQYGACYTELIDHRNFKAAVTKLFSNRIIFCIPDKEDWGPVGQFESALQTTILLLTNEVNFFINSLLFSIINNCYRWVFYDIRVISRNYECGILIKFTITPLILFVLHTLISINTLSNIFPILRNI